MTERTKTIKGLISGQVDMGTFGLVELELLAIEKENEALRKHAVISRRKLLLDFAEYSENDKTSTTLDECVDNYIDSIKQ